MEKDKVLVDKDSIPRCGWCGTYYSPEWIKRSQYEESVYCSPECALAATSQIDDLSIMFWNRLIQTRGLRYLYGILIIISFVLLLTFPVQAPIWIGLQVVCFCCLCIDSQSERFREKLPEGLARKDMYREGYHLELECAFCSHLNPPEITDCRHCGASLRDSTSMKGTIPEWFQTDQSSIENDKIIGRCPHCYAVYIYPKEEMQTCHNCGKRFTLIRN